MNFKAKRELFYFTQRERSGVIVLICLIFIFLAIHIALPYFYKDKPIDTSKWENEVNQYLSLQGKKQQQSDSNEFVQFNPNSVSLGELTKMGVPAKVASNWIRYLEKGGRFKKKEDVGKIYGMTTALYDQLERFISLPQEAKRIPDATKTAVSVRKKITQNTVTQVTDHRTPTTNHVLKKVESVELNSADSTGLENLPGIGPVLASRIIRYRNLLGGYYSVAQLHEVYGLRDEHFNSASPYLNIDPEHFRKFNINFASISELGRHPYIGFKAARKIIKLRDEKGKYSSVDDLAVLMTIDSLKKLSPYLTFNVK